MRLVFVALISLFVGGLAGWKLRYFAADGPDGVQWQFSDAARRGDIPEMKKLITAGADPLKIPSYADGAVTSATGLFEAALAGEPEAVEFLIERGADVNQVEGTETPLDVAEHRKAQTEKTIMILKQHGAKPLHE